MTPRNTNPASFVLALCAACAGLALSTASVADSSRQFAITQARADGDMLHIHGINVDGGRPRVTLGTLTLAVVSMTANRIDALIPASVVPGSYLLTVNLDKAKGADDRNDDDGKYDEFWVTIGAAGPQGPVGAQGPAGRDGATGPQGPAGPSGKEGAAGPQGLAGPAGKDGAAGPQGPQGPAGASSNLIFLRVSGAGIVIRSSAGIVGVSRTPTANAGTYAVDTASDVGNCAIVTSVGSALGGFAAQGIGGRHDASGIVIRTYDVNGVPADRDFSLIIAC